MPPFDFSEQACYLVRCITYRINMNSRSIIATGFFVVTLALLFVGSRAANKIQGTHEVLVPKTTTELTRCEERIRGRDFSVELYTDQIAAPLLSQTKTDRQYDPETDTIAWNYRTRIREATGKGVNYGGRYAIAQWSLGTGYQNHAIVNVETGEIIYYGLKSQLGTRYGATSTLLIVNPIENFSGVEDREEALQYAERFIRLYYAIENDSLKLLCTESASEGIERKYRMRES
jgi:hypothetical protein